MEGRSVDGHPRSPRTYSISARIKLNCDDSEMWLFTVYGPSRDADKPAFLVELHELRSVRSGPWLLNGDFNLIYRAQDKNNSRLNRRLMGQFRRFLNEAELDEIHLTGRLYTWSNERSHPTLEKIDRFFVSADWRLLFPDCDFQSLASLCSDHAPLLLRTDATFSFKKRFHFKSIWTKFPSFLDVVRRAWNCPLNGTDPFKRLDWLLRNTARSLQSWSARFVGSIRSQLEIAKEILYRLEIARDHRSLADHEERLRKVVKLKSLGLSSLQRTVARQESRLLWLSEGDAPTKFFHIHANARQRKKFIHTLVHQGQVVVDEAAKAQIAFDHFDALLGTPPQRTCSIELSRIGLPMVDMAGMDDHFIEQEIWNVIKSLHPDKAPGPDGFTARFLQVTWEIIRPDIMVAFDALWHKDGRSLHSINDAILILLPKSAEAPSITDYRPISLIHCLGKLFSKVLANRLAPKLQDLVHISQSAFIKGRSIHDNFRFVHKAAKLLHARKKSRLLLKIDIAKAFDLVAWPFLLELMAHMGFPPAWLEWTSMLLSTASTRISMNGAPGARICHARGLRQGDPLSPMLFLLVMEALSALIRKADEWHLFADIGAKEIPHRASLYADDLILFISPVERDLRTTREILKVFEGASGLGCNMQKCQLAPIRCDDSMVVLATSILPCTVTDFPIRYLGVPLSVKKLPKTSLQPLIDKVADRLPTWKGRLMNRSGRLALIKSTLSAIPIHIAINLKLDPWAIKALEKIMKAFLWSGTEVVSSGKCSVAWAYVQRPLQLGGLGVLDPQRSGQALRLRWIWLRRTRLECSWARLPADEDVSLLAFFNRSVRITLGDGTSVLFWSDPWLEGKTVQDIAPQLLQAVPLS